MQITGDCRQIAAPDHLEVRQKPRESLKKRQDFLEKTTQN